MHKDTNLFFEGSWQRNEGIEKYEGHIQQPFFGRPKHPGICFQQRSDHLRMLRD